MESLDHCLENNRWLPAAFSFFENLVYVASLLPTTFSFENLVSVASLFL
uniref:Uncharacterized protein n=1 Tax=Arundo donax TaxID=35708 RepID=A0A0A9BDM0_ARUDO